MPDSTNDSVQVANAPIVEAIEVHKSFGDLEVLKGIDLTVPQGAVVCLVGASGSGKSTFLRCINHLERIDRGQLLVEGGHVGYNLVNGRLLEMRPNEIAKQRSNIGMVFQHFNLFPHLTVLENVVLAPMRVLGRDRKLCEDEAHVLLKRVGLDEKADVYPAALSGGQKQRAAIARALAMRPRLMLFDEPTSALDPELVGEVLEVMLELARDGMSMIVVTHELGFAREVGDELVFMDGGRVIERGDPREMIASPQESRTKEFFSRVI